MTTSKPTVLIVDDSEQKRYAISRYLKAAGFDTLETGSGEEAIQMAREQPGMLIALDVNLPDMVGYEVTRRLRSDPRTSRIPIVQISSTFTNANSKALGLESGADTYLTGPVEPEELVATMRAMIRMRKAEAEAMDYAAKWQATFDAISNAVLLVNSQGVIERCNRSFSELVKQPAERVVGKNLSALAESGFLDEEVYFRMLGSRKREVVEKKVNEQWYSISADPVLDPEGNIKGGVLIIANISDRKAAEEAKEREKARLTEEAQRLEAKVKERTRQLEESVRSLEGFCYTIAHDLRAPLRAMDGLTSELVGQYSQFFDEEGKMLAGRITAAARKMDRLIDELLAFGRVANSDLPCRMVDLEIAFNAVIANFEQTIEEKKATIEIESPLPQAWANPSIVDQVAGNLVSNALKFVEPRVAPRVVVRAETREKFIRVWVEDNGIGIEPSYHRKIFGLFERLHSDAEYKGTGIGLAIVQKGVERLGGRTGVESELGKGSRFWFELPKSPPK